MISFDIIIKKKYFIWNMRRKIKKHFNIKYCRKSKEVSTLIDENNTYIIKVFKNGFHFIIVNENEDIENTIDNCIDFINKNFKNTSIGFTQSCGKDMDLSKFKDIEVIELLK